MPLLLEIPDAIINALDIPRNEIEGELRAELAAILYARGALPVGKAMELAGASRREFESLLKERQIRRPFDEAELQRELAWSALESAASPPPRPL